MQTVHEAANALEAHVLKDVLRQQGISAQVLGEHLQGGIGELPLGGLIRLVVDEGDAARARQLLREWEAEQPPDALSAPSREPRWPVFVLGLLSGMLLMAALQG